MLQAIGSVRATISRRLNTMRLEIPFPFYSNYVLDSDISTQEPGTGSRKHIYSFQSQNILFTTQLIPKSRPATPLNPFYLQGPKGNPNHHLLFTE